MRRILALLVLCLLLTGCYSWMDGNYSSVRPYTERTQQYGEGIVSASSYTDLRDALTTMVENGEETLLLNVAGMTQDRVEINFNQAVSSVLRSSPIAAYAVEGITSERGTSGGQSALFVTVKYNHNRSEIAKIKRVDNMDSVKKIIATGLEQCESRVLVMVSDYRGMDIAQYVQDYAAERPDLVMEVPQVMVNRYPESGSSCVLEIVFSYQSSRDSLRNMQSRVKPLFTSAELYVSGSHADHDKYGQLYTFLMERHEYTVETSITPSYSLLVHGVGDSRAFATVFAAMCRRAGLECMVVSGTREGEPLFWNIIHDGEYYRHVDLIRSNEEGSFLEFSDADMTGYVWDYSAYPECTPEPEPEVTEPEETVPDETLPEEGEPTEPSETIPEETVGDETTE